MNHTFYTCTMYIVHVLWLCMYVKIMDFNGNRETCLLGKHRL